MPLTQLGEIEVLVAGAGDTYFGKLAEISTDEFDSQLQIHLVGANRLATAVLPGMLERQRGDLIFVGSEVALRQRPHMGAYGAAKAALVAMVNEPPDGARGHRCARLDRASRVRPRPAWAGACPPTRSVPHLRIGRSGARPDTTTSCVPSDLARAITFVAETPRGGYIANMELQPEAPLASAPAERQKLVLNEENLNQ